MKGAAFARSTRRSGRRSGDGREAPVEEPGEDGPYAEQDRLLRFAFGTPDEEITERGSAWASESIRTCLAEYGHVGTDDGEARVRFTAAEGCELTLSLAIHSMPGEGFDPETADEPALLGASTGTFGPGQHTLTVDLP